MVDSDTKMSRHERRILRIMAWLTVAAIVPLSILSILFILVVRARDEATELIELGFEYVNARAVGGYA